MPDLNHSIAVHNANMPKWWGKAEYIRERKAFVKRNPTCARCGRPATTPGHSHEDYRNYETYLAAVVNDKCVPLCPACNVAERKGMKPCPECVKKKSEKIYYILQDKDRCFECLPESERSIISKCQDAKKQFIRAMHDRDNTFRREVYAERKAARKASA